MLLLALIDKWSKLEGWWAIGMPIVVVIAAAIAFVMTWAALRATLDWRRYGGLPLRIDPAPARIGQALRGRLTVREILPSTTKFQMGVSCIGYRIDGSADSRTMKSQKRWRDERTVLGRRKGGGTLVEFLVELPSDQPPSDIVGKPVKGRASGELIAWHVDVYADVPGIDLYRSYVIQVRSPSRSKWEMSGTLIAAEATPTLAVEDDDGGRVVFHLPVRGRGKRTKTR